MIFQENHWLEIPKIFNGGLLSISEIEHYIKEQGAIGNYLYNIFTDYQHGRYAWSKPLWDITTIAYLVDPHWVPTVVCPSPVLTDNYTWSFDQRRHFHRVALDANRHEILGDLFCKLQRNRPVKAPRLDISRS